VHAAFEQDAGASSSHFFWCGENRQHTGVAIQVVMGNFATGKKTY
jgi:hypothetical protein